MAGLPKSYPKIKELKELAQPIKSQKLTLLNPRCLMQNESNEAKAA